MPNVVDVKASKQSAAHHISSATIIICGWLRSTCYMFQARAVMQPSRSFSDTLLNKCLNIESTHENGTLVGKGHNNNQAALRISLRTSAVKLQEGLMTTLFHADPIIFHSPPRRQRGPGSQAWGGQGRPPTCRDQAVQVPGPHMTH